MSKDRPPALSCKSKEAWLWLSDKLFEVWMVGGDSRLLGHFGSRSRWELSLRFCLVMSYVAFSHSQHCLWVAAALWSLGGGLAIVCGGGWQPFRRHSAVSLFAGGDLQGVRHQRINWRGLPATVRDASQSTRDDVSCCSSGSTSSEWCSYQHLGGCGSLGGSVRGVHHGFFEDYHTYQFGFRGKEVEIRADPGPAGRRRVLLPSRRFQEQVLRQVRGEDGGTSPRQRGPHVGTVKRVGKENKNFEDGSVRGLRSVGPLSEAGLEIQQVHHVCFDGRRDVCLEAGAWSFVSCALGSLLQSHADSVRYAGPCDAQQPGYVGIPHRTPGAEVPHVLASHRGGRTQGPFRAPFKNTDEDKIENGSGTTTTAGLHHGGPLGHRVANGPGGCGVLAGAGTYTCVIVAGERKSWCPSHPCGGHGSVSIEWRGIKIERRHREGRPSRRRKTESQQEQGEERSQEETTSSRTRRAAEVEAERKWKGWRKRGRKPQVLWRRGMLRLEQRQRRLQRARSRRTMPGLQDPVAQVHNLQESGASFSQLPFEEKELKGCRTDWIYFMAELFYQWGKDKEKEKEEMPSSSFQPGERSKDKTSKMGKFGKDSDNKIQGDKVEIDGTLMSFEDYLAERCFTFMHHFAGPSDNLGMAVKEESEKLGLKVRVVSVDEAQGENLLDSEPYITHLGQARKGHLDGYHSGFPCSSYSVLRLREAEGMPGPVRNSDYPYGIPGQPAERQAEADRGTIMMSRSINMAEAVIQADEDHVCPAFVTMENPPPTSREGHVSAWEMPEMLAFLKKYPKFVKVNFDTCIYQPDVELGQRTFKPQIFGGTLQGLTCLRGFCQCGDHRHRPVIGTERSRESGTYPRDLCRAYGRLAAAHFMRMAHSEFLDAKTRILKRHIAGLKEVAEGYRKEYGKITPTTPPKRPSFTGVEEAPKKKRKTEDLSHSESEKEEATGSTSWIGGRGKYGMVRESKSKSDLPRSATFVGGMRDPLKSVNGLPTVKALGERVRQRWQTFITKFPEVMETAETYGTDLCKIHHDAVDEWRKILASTFGESRHKQVFLRPAGAYQTPLDVELLRAWRDRAGDPERHVTTWLSEGAPLGIEREIESSGIFPPVLDEESANVQEVTTLAELERRGFKNYLSVEDNKEDAEVELCRYEKQGYMARIPKEEALRVFENGTVSRLALVVKMRPDNTKKLRIVIDLKRSGGNAKSSLPEKLVLPRPLDAIRTFREQRAKQGKDWDPSDGGFEMALVDISDAFTTLPLHEAELKHAMAPSTVPEEILVFKALLFGYRTAPLLYSRLAAMMSRMVQSFVDPKVAAHQTYLDDSLWILMGSLKERHSNLALIRWRWE